MTTPIVLLIHGMGTHNPTKITKEFTKALNTAAKKFQLSDFDAAKSMDIEEFNYSDTLDKLREDYAKQASSIEGKLAFLTGAGVVADLASKLISFESKFGDDDFTYTHLLDVVFYSFSMHREQIVVDCGEKIIALARKADQESRPFHIIAHSLGTALAHDTLYRVYKHEAPASDPNHIDPNRYALTGLWSVANVSRLLYLLTGIKNPHNSIVHDHQADDPGICARFYPVRCEYDPFTWFKTYRRKPKNGTYIKFDGVRKLKGDLPINPHDFQEYIEHPSTSSDLLWDICDIELSDGQYDAGVEAYEKTTITGQVKDVLQDIKDAVPTSDELDKLSLKEKFELIKELFDTIKKAMDELKKI